MTDKKIIRDFLEESDYEDVITLYNALQESKSIFSMDEFDKKLKDKTPGEIAVILHKSDHFNYEFDDYFIFTDVGGVLSFNSIFSYDDILNQIGFDFFIAVLQNLNENKWKYLEGIRFEDNTFINNLRDILSEA